MASAPLTLPESETIQIAPNPAASRRSERPTSLLDLTLPELEAKLAELGHPAYRARQVARWVYGHDRLATAYDQMTDLPAGLRRDLAESLPLTTLERGARGANRQRRHHQDPLPHRRRPVARNRAHALPRPGHRLRLLPGRLRGRLRLLRHRSRRVDPQPHRRRDGRANPRRRPPRPRARPAVDQPRHDGDGRTAPELRRDDEDGRHPPRTARVQLRRPPDDDFHLGHRAQDRRPGRGAVSGQPRRLAPRAGRRAAQHARADQPALAGRGADGRRRPLHRQAPAAASPSSTP